MGMCVLTTQQHPRRSMAKQGELQQCNKAGFLDRGQGRLRWQGRLRTEAEVATPAADVLVVVVVLGVGAVGVASGSGEPSVISTNVSASTALRLMIASRTAMCTICSYACTVCCLYVTTRSNRLTCSGVRSHAQLLSLRSTIMSACRSAGASRVDVAAATLCRCRVATPCVLRAVACAVVAHSCGSGR